jgi:hypothetical protein
MDDDTEDQGLLQRARAELEAGRRPEAVYATLVTDTLDPRAAALAVCCALGIPREEARQRWIDTGEPLTDLVQPGEPAELGAFLELAGFFDVHRQLDERELPVRQSPDQALATIAAGGLPSGYAHGLSRKFQTGRLAEAFVSMATHGARRQRPVPAAYWTHLLAAANLLAITDDDRFESCVALCRQMLDQSSTPTPE